MREYENRIKIAEEKVKRERQGYKERTKEMEGVIEGLERQVSHQKRVNAQLDDVLEHQG